MKSRQARKNSFGWNAQDYYSEIRPSNYCRWWTPRLKDGRVSSGVGVPPGEPRYWNVASGGNAMAVAKSPFHQETPHMHKMWEIPGALLQHQCAPNRPV